MTDKETIEEFLARGGEIQKCEAQELEEIKHIIRPVNPTAQIMLLDHGELFFGEKQTRKKMSNEEKNQKGRDKFSGINKYLKKRD